VSFLPEIPSIAESGYPEYQYSAWIGLAAPVGTPRAIIDKLAAAGQSSWPRPRPRRASRSQYIPIAANTPAEQEELVRSKLATWGKHFKDWKIEPQ